MRAQLQPLIAVFAEIPDLRRCRGKRQPLPAVLALACCAMVCGYRSYSAMAAWGHTYGPGLAQALGFTHNAPWAATRPPVLRQVDRDTLEATLGAWAAQGVVTIPAAPSASAAAIALEGKTLRGSRQQGAPGGHWLAALSQRLGLTLAQQAVDDTTNAITQGEPGLRQRVLQDRVVTLAALLPPRPVAQPMGDGGGAYVMTGKENQPQLRAAIALILT